VIDPAASARPAASRPAAARPDASRIAAARAATGLPAPGDLSRWLTGEWTIARAINGNAGRFEGRARFTPDPREPDVLLWHERGRLRLGAHDGPAERTLRIAPAAGGAWEVRFADGRPFHRLDLRSGICEATHRCGADFYHARYAVEGGDRFTVTWRITGPHKHDLIESSYSRVPADRPLLGVS